MGVATEFFIDFVKPFFEGLITIFANIFLGIFKMFNIMNYIEVINNYDSKLGGSKLFLIVLAGIFLLLIYITLFVIIYKLVKGIFKYHRNKLKQDAMLEEIDRLNLSMVKLKEDKNLIAKDVDFATEGTPVKKKEVNDGESRFYKLTKVDERMKEYVPAQYNKDFKLNEFCEHFRNYSASRLGLFYDIKIIRLFVSALASNRLIILQGISGTGKTSLAYAFGQLINNPVTIASVQPSWRDSTELFGYFNEFTKKYNETEVLTKLYEATYIDDVYITLLDEMNISRVEYYFAEMLSILELPSQDNWVIDIVPNAWDNDPIGIKEGRLKLPNNMWYIGTINNDDSTFMVTDKVYDRAMPISIDTKCSRFDAPDTEPMSLSSTYLVELFKSAQVEYKVSDDVLNKIEEMDQYVIDHFRLAFGNRIVKHINEFVPVYVACGGDELDAIDYLITYKIFRKFEQLNLSMIKGEIDDFIKYLNNLFGDGKMAECITYLERLKKMI